MYRTMQYPCPYTSNDVTTIGVPLTVLSVGWDAETRKENVSRI